MISETDFIHIPYTPDLTEAGITFALRSLPYTYDEMVFSPINKLQRVVGRVAVELAFRRFLGEQRIKFDVKGASPFTNPIQFDLLLGGHHCDIKTTLITHRSQINDLHHNIALLLKANALIAADQFASDARSDQDLYLFAFVTGLITNTQKDIEKVTLDHQPTCLIYMMPKDWARPVSWKGLGPLALKSESDQSLTIELGGQTANRDYLSKTINLPMGMRVQVDPDFFSLLYLTSTFPPKGRIGLNNPSHNQTCLIPPQKWGNIWVYGIEIIFVGYLTREEFRRRAKIVAAGSRVFQYNRTRIKNLSVPIENLRPIGSLLERVKEWEARKVKFDKI